MSAAAKERPANRLLYETGEWNFDTLKRTYDAIEEIAVGELGLDTYPNQIEMISAEQMLDAYSSIGMPTDELASSICSALITSIWLG